MNNCLMCKKKPARVKFCSSKCVKQAWYLRNNPNARSYLRRDPKFWDSATGIGFKWEQWAADFLGAVHNEFVQGCDLSWDGRDVDVKVCELYKRKNKRGKPVVGEQRGVWVFNRNKLKKCDFFFCICLLNGKLHKKYLIPADRFPLRGAVVGHVSKYDVFLV